MDNTLEELNSVLSSVLVPNNVILVLYLVIGTIGNLTVIYFYLFKMKSKRTHRFFIPTLAVMDLLACTIGGSFALSLNLLPVMFRGDYLCKVLWYSSEATTLSSGLMLLVIAVERYLKVCKPFDQQMDIKWKRIAICLSVALSAAFSVPVFKFYGEIEVQNIVHNITGYRCGHDPFDAENREALVIYDFFLFAFALIGAITLTILYGFIGHAVYKQLKKDRQRKKANIQVPRIEISDHSSMMKNRDSKYPGVEWRYPSGMTTPSDSKSNSRCNSSGELYSSANFQIHENTKDERINGKENQMMCDRLNGEENQIKKSIMCSDSGENSLNETRQPLLSEGESNFTRCGNTNAVSGHLKYISNDDMSCFSDCSKIVEPSHSERNSNESIAGSSLELPLDGSLCEDVVGTEIEESEESQKVDPCISNTETNMHLSENVINKLELTLSKATGEVPIANCELLSPSLIVTKSKNNSSVRPTSQNKGTPKSPTSSWSEIIRKPRLSIDMLKMPRIKGKTVRNHFSVYRYSYMFMIITIVFIISFAPRIGLMVQEATDPYFWAKLSDEDIAIHLFLYRMYIINHVANPFIYGSFDSAFRRKLWTFCCRYRVKSTITKA